MGKSFPVEKAIGSADKQADKNLEQRAA